MLRDRYRGNGETLRRSRSSFHGFHFPIARPSIRVQRIQQLARDVRHAVDRASECLFVSF
jgi:hypothetical protein